MKKVIILPVYESYTQAQTEIKKYDFSFAYKAKEKFYYKKKTITLPEEIKVIEVPYNEIYIQITGDSESLGLTYIDDKFLTFNELRETIIEN
jgi:hypothetical protein